MNSASGYQTHLSLVSQDVRQKGSWTDWQKLGELWGTYPGTDGGHGWLVPVGQPRTMVNTQGGSCT